VGKEYLALSRDVLGLAVLFLMPAAFIVVMSLALSDVFKGGAGAGLNSPSSPPTEVRKAALRAPGWRWFRQRRSRTSAACCTLQNPHYLDRAPGFERALDTPPARRIPHRRSR